MKATKGYSACIVMYVFLMSSFVPHCLRAAEVPREPSIELTAVPSAKLKPGPTETGTIRGKVSGVPFAKSKVVIYAKGGDTYYVQPTAESPYSEIAKDGTFEEDIHGGTEYVALLVESSYEAKATVSSVPKVGSGILAVVRKKPTKE